MEAVRKPFQAVMNIIRFNWHLYLLSVGLIILALLMSNLLHSYHRFYFILFSLVIVCASLISLLVSFYTYDLSDLYQLNWLGKLNIGTGSTILNVHAGFDETSSLLATKYPNAQLFVFDFYDPSKHTEISIKRARKAYPSYPSTQQINTTSFPLPGNSADVIFLMLSAHEIRNQPERTIFFQELARVMKDAGKIVVTEHLRDFPNFLAYNLGFFHFIPASSWRKTFTNARLNVHQEFKITAFITTFVLQKYGASS